MRHVAFTPAMFRPKYMLRKVDDRVVRAGARLFERAQCAACQLPTLKTGDQPSIPILSFQIIHPFTDLLLHDM